MTAAADYELSLSFLYGELSDEQFNLFVERLRREPVLVRGLLDLAVDEELLRESALKQRREGDALWHRESESTDASSATSLDEGPVAHLPKRRQSILDRASRHPMGPAVAVATFGLVAIVLLAALTPVGRFFASGDDGNHDERKPSAPQEIATLTGWHRIDWKDGYHLSGQNHRLRAGQKVAMLSGLAEITYDTGAKVVLEGPCEFILGNQASGNQAAGKKTARSSDPHPLPLTPHPSSSNSGYLELGRLVARCDTPASKGFTIATPAGAIEDLGTEFGVDVDNSGLSKVVVLSGAVDVVRVEGDGQEQRVRLVKNEGAVMVAAGGTIRRRSNIDPLLMAAMRKRLDARFSSQLPSTQRQVSSIISWDFTASEKHNQGPATGPVMVGPVDAKFGSGFGHRSGVAWNSVALGPSVNPDENRRLGRFLSAATAGPLRTDAGVQTEVVWNVTSGRYGFYDSEADNRLRRDVLFLQKGYSDSSVTWEISGLVPGNFYSIAIFGQLDQTDGPPVHPAAHTITGSNRVFGPKESATVATFLDVRANGDGKITGMMELVSRASSMSGMQIVGEFESNGTVEPEGESGKNLPTKESR